MNKLLFRILISGLLLVSCFEVSAQALTLEQPGRYELKNFTSHLRDKMGLLAFEEVRERGKFELTSQVNFGFDEGVHWFSFEVENRSLEKEWLIEIAFSPLDHVSLYYELDSAWISRTAGDQYPVSDRDEIHPHHVLAVPLDPGTSRKFYLRVKSTSSIQVPAYFWSEDEFHRANFNLQIFNGLFYGALIIMLIYQLFLFFSTGDKVSLYYACTLAAMMHVVSYFQGYSFLYFYPERPYLNEYMAVFTGPFFLFFSTYLTRTFLNLKETHPLLDKLLLVNLWVDVAAAFAMLFYPEVVSYRFHHYAILVHCLLALLAAAYSIYRRYRPALYYMISWITLLVCAFVFSLSNLGVFNKYLITDSTWLVVGCLLQMLFISFAIGNRWILLNRKSQLARELALRRGLQEKERLEQEVILRTEEIQAKNRKLEEVNNIKDKLFSVVSHDIKGPLTSLQLALGLIREEAISADEFRDLAGVLESRFNQTTEFIENMLQWASLQLKGITFDPVILNVNELAQNTFKLLDYEIRDKELVAVNQVPESASVYADVNMVRSILRNLLMNAIKFSRRGGTIRIEAKLDDDCATISVTDTGVGIPAKNKETLFSLDSVTTPGTKQEKGTGLGLLLCREFVERNGGRIWLESEEGQGTTFYFTLPVSKTAVKPDLVR